MINWKDCSYSDNRPLISSQTFSSSSFANAKFSCISVLYLSQFDFFFKTFEDATSNSPFSVFSDQTINLLIKKIIIRFDVQWKSSVFKGFCADFSFKKNTHTHTQNNNRRVCDGFICFVHEAFSAHMRHKCLSLYRPVSHRAQTGCCFFCKCGHSSIKSHRCVWLPSLGADQSRQAFIVN